MAMQEQIVDYQPTASIFGDKLRGSLISIAKSIRVWIDARADAWAAATLYDELRRLSDAELRRRGLSRDMVARHAFKSFD
jgi:hypothetical protein